MLRRDNTVKWIVIAAVSLVLVSALGFIVSLQKRNVSVYIAGHTVNARVAKTPGDLERGLSGTRKLADNEGLLLVFDKPANWGVWMKDMHYSLDVIWIDESHKIVHIEKDISPDTYPTVFTPGKPAKYILEVPAGFSNRTDIGINTIVSFRTWLW